MNWRKIDEAWRNFAAHHNLELKFDEKHYLAGVRVNYLVEFTDNTGSTVYSGLINKSTSGYSLYKASVTTKITDNIQLEEIEVRRRNRLAKLFKSLNSSTLPFDKQIEECLKRVNATKIVMQQGLLTMDFDSVPTNIEGLNLIEKTRGELIRKASR